MDRQIVYPGQILPETSLLQMTKDAMIGSAKLASAMLGTGTIANGFAVTPTGPASLQVVVAPGEIYSLANIDSLAFSSLPADTTHSIMKQGIMLDGLTLSCPAPTTTGQSINYLVQATYQDQDSAPVLLPYYNSANPALPFSGMGNNGLTQNTARKGVASVQVKAGASAATGSQVTPAPDSGYVGLYVVTVASGQSTITSASISQYIAAPLLPSGIVQGVQNGTITYAADSGTANIYAATYTPAITSLADGMVLRFKAKNSNTAASTFSPNGLPAKPIVGLSLGALAASSILANGHCAVCYSQVIDSWILTYSLGAGINWSAISGAPTTLAGYGIAVASAGDATTGSDDVKPVTSLKIKGVFAARGIWDVSVVSTNANTARSVGLYSLNSAVNGPDGGVGLYQMLSSDSGSDPTWQMQLAQGVALNRLFIRSIKKDQSATTPWDEIYSTGNNNMVGASVGFYLNAPPTGWLKENGAAVSRTNYAKLFAIIGTAFGAGDGSTTFNLPDHRGEFPRGTDDTRGVDPGRLVGSTQAQAIQSHSHPILNKSITYSFSAAGGGSAPGGAATGATELTGGTETRPRNIAKLYCIKY